MRIDFHAHVLPGIDDGSPDIQTSLAMLRALRAQKIDTVVLTPHFKQHQTDIDTFFENRERSFQQLKDAMGDEPFPQLILGAEVYLEYDLDKNLSLDRLKIQGTPYMMIELPYFGFIPAMLDRMFELCNACNCIPMVAHLDRYLYSYRPEHLKMIAEDLRMLIQLNASSLLDWKTRLYVMPWIKSGRPIVFGSDTHNMKYRPPRMAECFEILEKKLKTSDFQRLMNIAEDAFRMPTIGGENYGGSDEG